MSIAEERAAVRGEALTWIGTPYHPNARVKGAGVDCLTLIVEVFLRAGVVDNIVVPPYSPAFAQHRSVELYLDGVSGHCVEVPGPPERAPLPGDIVLWRFGRAFSHGAIVTDWPRCVHAWINQKVGLVDGNSTGRLSQVNDIGDPDVGKPRPRKFFTLKRWVV